MAEIIRTHEVILGSTRLLRGRPKDSGIKALTERALPEANHWAFDASGNNTPPDLLMTS